ncbi:MAG: hypothetical protein WEA99_13980 [Brumimicrobium sp.]
MKYLILLFLTVLLFSCKGKLTQFYIDYNFDAIVPASAQIDSPVTLNTPEKTTNSEVEFESNDTRKDKIEQIILEDLELTIISPDDETFSFLNDIEIYLSSENLPEIKIAYKEDIPENVGDKIICEVIKKDLKEYIMEESITIRLTTVTDEVITEDVEVDIFTNFFVDAKLIK